MPETLIVNNFSAGWCPSDDAVNGRANALLQMDNVELDINGAIQLIGGTQKLYNPYSATAHTMFSRYINNLRCDYAACADGSIFRNNTSIATGGDLTNAAFSTAFNFTLICSGSVRLKDNGTSVVNLGVGPATVAPGISQSAANAPWAIITAANFWQPANVGAAGSGKPIVLVNGGAAGTTYLELTPAAYVVGGSGAAIIQSYGSPVSDCTTLSSVAGAGTSTDQDFVTLNGYTANPFGVGVQLDILLVAPDINGDVVSDYYTYTVQDISQATSDLVNFDKVSGVWTLKIPRYAFNRIGGGTQDWHTVYGYRLTILTPSIDPSYNTNVWPFAVGEPLVIQGGTIAQFGTYQWTQVNVNNTGSYLAKSVVGPITNPVTVNGNCALVTPQVPTDSQVNEIWIFRNGGNLGGTWYRTIVIKSPWPATYDAMGDQAALDLDITINLNLVSIASITDKVYDIAGPIQGRWYYFTTNFMYPSDVNDPDLVDTSIAVRICGSASELLMWARPVSASVVIVGTSIDCYLLTGTFSTFPDGTIDVYYQSLGVKFPPISYDAVAYGGAIYYMAADGWRMLLPTSFGTTYSSQNNQLIVAPNTDRLYIGQTCYGYLPSPQPGQPGSRRFPVTIVKNKLWCFVTTTGRAEVYDFTRTYWRTFNYNLGDAAACVATQDNKILVNYVSDKITREVAIETSKLIDGATSQNYKMMFTYKDNGKPRQRKDTYTFKSRCLTGDGVGMQITITDEKEQAYTIPTLLTVRSSSTVEAFVDLSQPLGSNLPKSYLIQLSGTTDNLIVEDWSIDYDARPVPLTFLRIYPTNFGQPAPKRLRTWPLVIDTLGNNVTFTPSVDNLNLPPTTFNTNYKKTVFYYVTSDAFGIDYGGTLLVQQLGEMEVWDTGIGVGGLAPDIVQTLPVPTEFDQVGPLEIFRWGKIVRMALRCFSVGTPIPYTVYLSDQSLLTGVFNVIPGVEDEYIVDVPKGISGRILRVTLGPCGFTFNKYFMKFQVAISGAQKDTELQWITIPGITSQLSGGI